MQLCPKCRRVRIRPALRMMRKVGGNNYEETWAMLFASDKTLWDKAITAIPVELVVCPQCEKKGTPAD